MDTTDKLVKFLCKAIGQKRLIKFYYESKSGKRDRTVRPYMIGINKAGNLELAGLPIEELTKPIDDRISAHYLLNQLPKVKVTVLSENYDNLGVPRKRVVDTPTMIKVICRFKYNDENSR